ncbi:type II secretion system F family protein [Anatilimnocola floriformis]|uniref:type II secretion system F family protein n=1 Tax=Anatilimnocola floriformis TaxID=2948575 RepID=UPI0020C1E7BA|nr:type II secretion system F family protein [Anatilimnocola floriformis]
MAETTANSTTELAQLLVQGTQSSLPLAEALLAAADSTPDRRLAKSLRAVAQRIQTGEPLPQILTKNSPLPASLSGLLKASLATGDPSSAITEWLLARQQAGAHWRNVVQSLTYPLVTLAGTYLLFLFLAFHVGPVLRQVVEDMGWQTSQAFLATYEIARKAASLSLLLLGGAAILLLLVRVIGGRRGWSQWMSVTPIFGPLWHWSGSSEFYRALAIMLERQIALPEALRLTGCGIADAALARHADVLAQRVEQGSTLTRAAEAVPGLPESTLPLIRVGERTDTLPATCRVAAEMLDARLQAQASLIMLLAPTVIYLLAGGLYAAMAAACIVPLRVFTDLMTSWGTPSPSSMPALRELMEGARATSWSILIVPGLAILVSLQILHRKRVIRSNLARIILTTAAWLTILLGLVGIIISGLSWLSLLFLPLCGLALMMLVDRYRLGEHQALINSLAFAADKGIPLPESALAFAAENVGDTGARAYRLATQLEAGVTLSAAARGARLRLNTAQRLAVNLSDVLVARGLALRTQLNWVSDSDAAFRVIVNRLLYFCGLVLTMLLVSAYSMFGFVLVFRRMFDEFGLRLPAPTLLLFEMADWIKGGGFLLLLPLLLAMLGVSALATIFYTGCYDFPVVFGSQARRRYANVADVARVMDLFKGLRYFFWRYDASLVLRSLSLLLEQRVPLPQALTLLANVYPRGSVRRRLSQVALDVEQGGNWLPAMQRQWLLGPAEVAVLQAAARADNLPWALDEMGDSLMRRMTYRLTLLHQILHPILLLIFGTFVAFVVVSLMLPLIALIQGLS